MWSQQFVILANLAKLMNRHFFTVHQTNALGLRFIEFACLGMWMCSKYVCNIMGGHFNIQVLGSFGYSLWSEYLSSRAGVKTCVLAQKSCQCKVLDLDRIAKVNPDSSYAEVHRSGATLRSVVVVVVVTTTEPIKYLLVSSRWWHQNVHIYCLSRA